jgi:phytanoyl-CoA hydroxylase
MLSNDAIKHYRTKGWVVVNDVFSRDEAEKIAELALKTSIEELKEVKGSYQADKSVDGKVAPRKIDHPFHKSEAFRAFVTNPRLVALLRELMGVEPLLFSDEIFMKPPRFGSAKPYHQDNIYLKCTPADHVINGWIALDDVDAENGCLRYIDGSHKEGLLPHDPVPGEPHNLAPAPHLIDLKRESLAIVRKGGVVFHHSETLHTSHRNESDRWRRAYATFWVAADVTSTSNVLDKAYFKEPTSV